MEEDAVKVLERYPSRIKGYTVTPNGTVGVQFWGDLSAKAIGDVILELSNLHPTYMEWVDGDVPLLLKVVF